MDYIDSDKDTKKYFKKKLWWNLLKNLGKDVSTDDLNDLRHSNQPTMFDLYIKNIGGDYRGRRDQVNVKINRRLGLEKFKKAIDDLENKVKEKGYKEEPEQGVTVARESFGFDTPKYDKKNKISVLDEVEPIGKETKEVPKCPKGHEW